MENNDQKLYTVFTNVNEWLRFAETKNAMIVAFNGVAFFGIVQLITNEKFCLNTITSYYLNYAMIMLAFSSLCALLSFVPRIRILGPNVFDFHSNDNFLYFDTLRKKNRSEILAEFYPNETNHTNYQCHLADQIISNSVITNKKYTYFTISLWLCIIGLFTPPIALIFLLNTYKKI